MFELRRTIAHSALGEDGKLTLQGAVDLMQDCSSFQIDSITPLAKLFAETNSGIYLAYRQLDIKRLPEYAEEVIVRTWMTENRSLFGYRNTNIYDSLGNPLIVSLAIGVFVNIKTGKPFRLPKEVERVLPIEERYDMEYTDRKIALSQIEPTKQDPFVVPGYFIDDYGHVNNAKYLSIAKEYLPKSFDVKRVRIEYLSAAKRGETIVPLVYEQEKCVTINLTDTEGKSFSIIQFQN